MRWTHQDELSDTLASSDSEIFALDKMMVNAKMQDLTVQVTCAHLNGCQQYFWFVMCRLGEMGSSRRC